MVESGELKEQIL